MPQLRGQLASTLSVVSGSLSQSNSAGAAANDNANGGTGVWNPSAGTLISAIVTLDDTSFDIASSTGGSVTQFLKTTGYGFAIPQGAVILGIQATVYYALANANPFTASPRLAKAGVMQLAGAPTVTSTSPYAPDNPNGFVTTYGGPTDLWGGTWAVADINNSGFGWGFAQTSAAFQQTDIDYVVLAVFYSPALPGLLLNDQARAGQYTTGSFAIVPIAAQATIIRPWTITGWAIGARGALLPLSGSQPYGTIGKVIASLLFGGSIPVGPPSTSNAFTNLPVEALQNAVQIYDGSQEPPFPWTTGTPPAGGYISAVQQLQQPQELGAGDRLAVGVWLTPSLVSAGVQNIAIYDVRYTIDYQ